METPSLLAAERLLAALRADGCMVAAEGERLIIDGPLTDARHAAITARKSELLAILAGEGQEVNRGAGLTCVAKTTPQAELADNGTVEPALTEPQAASRSMLMGFAEPEPEAIADPPQPEPPPPPPSWRVLPRGRVYNGHIVITPETMRWRARRDAARCKGRPFNEPAPEYCYPEFETDPKRREAMLNGWPIPPKQWPF
jgi:hypothetical protein